MSKYLKHFMTVTKHRWEVFKECAACGIPLQGLTHDLSKYGFTEFASSARYFQGNKSPIEAEKEEIGYSKAWLHHKGHNKHHWEYWTDFAADGSVIANRMPIKYVIEMACDWVGAGKVYSKEAWDQGEPLRYYKKTKAARHYHKSTEYLLFYLLTVIDEDGLKEFHRTCRHILYKKNSFFANYREDYYRN